MGEPAGRKAEAVLTEAGAEAAFVKPYVSRKADVDVLVARTLSRFGDIDILLIVMLPRIRNPGEPAPHDE